MRLHNISKRVLCKGCIVFKKIVAIIIIAVMIITINGCGKNSSLKKLSDDCGIDLSVGKVISEEDNHGGFQGDGFSLLVADFSEDVAAKSSTIRAFLPDKLRKKNNFARRTRPIRTFSIFSIAGMYNGNLRSTPTP